MMRRFRLRFTLRMLLVLVTAAATLFGYESYVARKEERAVRAIEGVGGSVKYESLGPGWLSRFAGPRYLTRVRSAGLPGAYAERAEQHLLEFGHLREVVLHLNSQISEIERSATPERVLSQLRTSNPAVEVRIFFFRPTIPSIWIPRKTDAEAHRANRALMRAKIKEALQGRSER